MALDDVLDLLRCPRCRTKLTRTGGQVRCPAGHSFDVARQGHLNLLGRAAPRNADTPAMVAARDRFLGRGCYAPIADRLAGLVRVPGAPADLRVLDAGAGTGYYLARVLQTGAGRGLALDVSVAACRRAARTPGPAGAVVADVWRALPVGDGAVDVVLSVFAPRHPGEFARVLAPGGRVVVVTPTPAHLAELRQPLGLLDVQDAKDERLADTLGRHAARRVREELDYTFTVDAAAAHDLVAMGPSAFHVAPGDLEARLRGLVWPRTVTAAVALSVWEAP